MVKKSFHFSLKIFAEILLGLFVFVFVGATFFAWKLMKGPIVLDQAIPYLEEQLNANSNQKIEIGSLAIEWQGIEDPLGVEARNVKVSNDKGPFLFSPEVDLNISLRRLLIGQFKIEALWIRRVAISITRAKDGQITITGQDVDVQEKTDSETTGAVPATLTLNSLVNDLPDMDVLWIDAARIVYRDLQNQKTHIFNPVTIFAETHFLDDEKKLAGFVTFPFGDSQKENVVKMNFNTLPQPLSLNISGSITQVPFDSVAAFLPKLPEGYNLDMVVNATANLTLDNMWQLQNVDINASADKGEVEFAIEEENQKINFSEFTLHAVENPNSQTLSVEDMSFKLEDTVSLSIKGSVSNMYNPEKMSGNIDTTILDMPQNWLPKYWPKSLSDNGAYEWLVGQMSGGVFSKINFTSTFDKAVKERSDKKPLPAWLLSARGEFEFDGVNVDYRAPLPASNNTKGKGVFEDMSLTLDIESANVGGLNVQNGTLYFDDLITVGSGIAKMEFPISGSAQDVFDLIKKEPISAFKNIDFKPKDAKGDVNATVKIELPLLKDLPVEDIKVDVVGTLNNANIQNVVRGLTLSGGPYDIVASTRDISVKGSGQIEGQPITLDFHEYFSTDSAKDYLSKISAQLTSNDKIRRAFIKDIAQYFKGDADINLNYLTEVSGKNTTIDLELDLGNTTLNVPDIGLKKSSGVKTDATLNVKLVNGDLRSLNALKVTGGVSLSNGELDFVMRGGEPTVTKATLKNIAFNENRLSVVANEQDGILKANVTGSFLDARPFLSGKKENFIKDDKSSGEGRMSEIGIDVSQLRAGDEGTIKNAKAYIKTMKTGRPDKFELDGFVGNDGKAGDLHVRYTPDVADGLTLRVESNNAGETLRAFGLYPYIDGGTLEIAGVPLQTGRFGDVQGRARINNFAMMKAPILLRLINRLSFDNFLSDKGLAFTRLESDFKWELGDGGDVYTIRNGTTSGASVAITFDGYVDTKNGNIHINGTAAPLSELNSFIGNIPIIGNLLTGGDALLAATYSVKGTTVDPSISVNPLSFLAPGIIRKMLFESEVKHEDAKEKEETSSVPSRPIGQLN